MHINPRCNARLFNFPDIRRMRNAFTMVELLMAIGILAIFMFFGYKVFIGGSKTAGRAQWTNATIDQLRNALALIQKNIQSTSYPTTLYANTILDPCDDAGVSEYYFKILKQGEIPAPDSGELEIIRWVVCEPEHPPNPGKITRSSLFLCAKATSFGKLADLVIRSQSSSYKKSGSTGAYKIDESALPEAFNSRLVEDVAAVSITFLGPKFPVAKPTDFHPIKVSIKTQYPKDPKLSRENSIMANPNVGVGPL